MKLDRTKNAKRNMIFGFVIRLYDMLVPFVIRTVMIRYIGVEYLGLSSLFASVLQVLNLAELGVGSAMVYSMYKPIVEDDADTICALLGLYRKYYWIIGTVIASLGLMLLPFLPVLIKGNVPSDINIYILYLMNLATTVISYWGFAYRSSITSAFQRTDISSKIRGVTATVQYALQIIVLIAFKSYYGYVIVYLLSQILKNIAVGITVQRLYPQYKPQGKLDRNTVKEINKKIRALFTAKLGFVIVNSVDTIVISAFLGLTALAVYQNYYFILTTIIGFISIIFGSCTAGIGNSLIAESKIKNFGDLKLLTFIISWIGGFCATCLLCLYQPFMTLWAGKDLVLGFPMVICFCIYFFVYEINQLLNTYKDAAGIWNRDKFRPLVTALTNLGLNLLMVNYWGLYGILLSTVLSMLLVGMPWLLHNLFDEVFETHLLWAYLRKLFGYVVIVVIGGALTLGLCSLIKLDGVALLAARLAVCCIAPNLFYLLVFGKKAEFKQALLLADNILDGKLSKVLKLKLT